MPDPIAALIAERPLLKFSVYTAIQADVLRAMGGDLLSCLDGALATPGVVGAEFGDLYGQLWLWVLGAYEMVRTMSGAPSCFSQSLNGEVRRYKKEIAKLRMPFAKQELPRSGRVIGNEASISGFDFQRHDVRFHVKNTIVSVRSLIEGFEGLVDGIDVRDVLKDFRDR